MYITYWKGSKSLNYSHFYIITHSEQSPGCHFCHITRTKQSLFSFTSFSDLYSNIPCFSSYPGLSSPITTKDSDRQHTEQLGHKDKRQGSLAVLITPPVSLHYTLYCVFMNMPVGCFCLRECGSALIRSKAWPMDELNNWMPFLSKAVSMTTEEL